MGKKQRRGATARRGPTPTQQQTASGGAPVEIAGHGITAFTPGQPVRPGPGIVAEDGTPRQFTFPSGYNIAQRPRALELTPFETLRQFAALYEGVQLCERVYLDILGRLELRVVPRKVPVTGRDGAGETAGSATVRRIEDFLARPDGERDLRGWMAAATRDLLEIDALAIYRRRRRDGKLWALELVDGALIKPLIDDLGRRPQPPAPAYQQFVWGMPAGLYTTDEMDYLCETPRTDSVYGVSRVERILYCINQALRKQAYDLARYTDGVVPAGILYPPEDSEWTMAQLVDYERQFNALLAGNNQQRVRVKVAPPGFTFAATHPQEPEMDFDRWLLNITTACFGLTMAELGMTEQVNKSSGETQENVVYRRAVRPLADFFARYLSRVVAEEFDPRYQVTWGGFEEPEDFASQAQALALLVQNGIIDAARAREMLGM